MQVYISEIAGFGFLTAGIQSQYGSLFGSILFALGLLAIVGYKLKLFTGTAGFIKKNEIGDLLIILLGNIIGCFMMGMLTRVSPVGEWNPSCCPEYNEYLDRKQVHRLRAAGNRLRAADDDRC